MTCWQQHSDIIIQLTINPPSEMYKKRSSSKKYGRPYKRRRMVSNNQDSKVPRSVSLSNWNTPVRTTMKYSDVVILATTVGTGFTTYTLRPSSLYDPDYTGTGHQPLRFDQMAAMFQDYRVRSATVKMTFAVGEVSVSASALGPWRCTVTKARQVTLPGTGTDYSTAAEMEGATTGVLTTQDKLTLYNNYVWTDAGVDDISALNVSTNNTNGWFHWIISVYNQGNVAATNVLCNFDITFDCEFLNPKTIATS